jgi:nitroreductase
MPTQDLGHAVLALFEQHRTIRDFTDESIAPEDLAALLASAQRAPSGASVQLGSFIRITDPQLRERVAQLANDQEQVRQAPEFFVACLDISRERQLIAHRGGSCTRAPVFTLLYGIIDATLMAANMATAAEALGYGVCFIGAIQDHLDEVAQLLDLPAGVLPVVGLCIGRPAAPLPSTKPRLPRDVVFMENRYRSLSEEELDQCLAAMAPTTRSGDWFRVLDRYWSPEGLAARREVIVRRALAQQGFEL